MLLKLLIVLIVSLFLMSNVLINKILFLSMSIFLFLLLLSLLVKSSWFFMLFCMVVMSGLMVMFIYMSSLSFVKFKNKFLYYYVIIFNIMILIMGLKINFFNYIFMNENIMNYYEKSYLMSYINWNYSLVYLFLMGYILLVLIVSMEMIKTIKNSFRAKN